MKQITLAVALAIALLAGGALAQPQWTVVSEGPRTRFEMYGAEWSATGGGDIIMVWLRTSTLVRGRRWQRSVKAKVMVLCQPPFRYAYLRSGWSGDWAGQDPDSNIYTYPRGSIGYQALRAACLYMFTPQQNMLGGKKL